MYLCVNQLMIYTNKETVSLHKYYINRTATLQPTSYSYLLLSFQVSQIFYYITQFVTVEILVSCIYILSILLWLGTNIDYIISHFP